MDRDAAREISAGIIAKINRNENDNAGDIVATALMAIWEDGWNQAIEYVIEENKKYRKGGL